MNLQAKARLRRVLGLSLLAVAAWLALFGDKTPPGAPTRSAAQTAFAGAQTGRDFVPPSRPDPLAAAQRRPATETMVAIEALIPRKQLLPESAKAARHEELFAPPQPPVPRTPPTPAPAPARAAPPVPFRVIGKKFEAGAWEVFLGLDDASYVVHVGSVVEANYRIDRIEPPSMVLTHLPTRQTQTLAIGEAW